MKKTLLSTLGLIASFIFITIQTRAQRVNSIDVSVDHPSYTGACPARITFKAVIHYSGAGTLRYQWVRSDGAHPPIMTIQLDGRGTRIINTSWQLGAVGKSYSGWEAVKVLSPVSFESAHGEFNLTCTGTTTQQTTGSSVKKNFPNISGQNHSTNASNTNVKNPPQKIKTTVSQQKKPVQYTPVQTQTKTFKPNLPNANKTSVQTKTLHQQVQTINKTPVQTKMLKPQVKTINKTPVQTKNLKPQVQSKAKTQTGNGQ